MITAEQIKPKNSGNSDFFSWQLYRWAKKYPERFIIWSATWNSATGINKEKRTLYIGDKKDGGWIHARQLNNLCLHGQKLEAYAYGPGHDTVNWTDITKDWWMKYMKTGVCAIHGDYAHEWNVNMDKRTCLYCEKTEQRITEMVERERWVNTIQR